MPELEVTIGGRAFQVSCRAGEEAFLRAAAGLMDTEARALLGQAGRLPETKMLLMAGLVVADRLAGLEEQLRVAQDKLAAWEGQPAPAPQRVEVAVIPDAVTETLAEIAARAEALAEVAEDRLAARIDALTAG